MVLFFFFNPTLYFYSYTLKLLLVVNRKNMGNMSKHISIKKNNVCLDQALASVPGAYTSSERLGNTQLNCLAWKNKGCWVSPRLKRLLTTLAAFEHYLLHCLSSLIGTVQRLCSLCMDPPTQNIPVKHESNFVLINYSLSFD